MDASAGEDVKRRRVALGLSVRSLAQHAGVDRARVTAIESGEQRVRPTTMGAVLRALDVLERGDGAELDEDRRTVRFVVENGAGVRVTVSGSIDDIDALGSAAAVLAAALNEK